MRILIVSDLHANWPALRSLSERADAVFFLGDAVNYGPHPSECVDWIERHATYAVRGNHDEAVSNGTDPRCSLPYRKAAEVMGAIHAGLLSPARKSILRGLPLRERVTLGKTVFGLVHACPSQPLYGYRTESELARLLPTLEVDVLVVGHTHLPFVRKVGDQLLINPGSVGQPKDGDPRASYAIWEDGEARLCRLEYPIEETVQAYRELHLPIDVEDFLVSNLRTGSVPIPAAIPQAPPREAATAAPPTPVFRTGGSA